MSTKYAVYFMSNGENKLYDTKELALEAFWNQVVGVALSLCHNTAYMVVEQNENGSEVWYNDNNEEISRPKSHAEIKELIEKARIARKEAIKIASSDVTPVEVLP